MGTMIELVAADGHHLQGWHALPAGNVRGGLVVVQEAFGLSAYVRSVVERFAALGYATTAPALYDRQQSGVALDHHDPQNLAQGRQLRAGLIWPKVLLDVGAAIDQLVHSVGQSSGEGVDQISVQTSGRSLERPSAARARQTARAMRVGIVGYCVGGSVSWLAAQSLSVTAAVAYYGRDIVDWLEPAPVCPTMLHFGDHDPLIPLADVGRIRARYPDMPIHVYPVGHGFDGVRAPGDQSAAQSALDRTLSFLHEHVG